MTASESPHVVYVDDDSALLDLGETYLRKLSSFEVTTCADPEAVLDIVCDSDIDCVVSDYDMPAMTGVELLETVREEHGSLPFILFTGKGSEEVASDAISAGVTDYLQKQPSSEQYELLVNRIENSVSEHRATRRAERYETVLEALGYPVYVVDERGQFTYVNDAFADLSGYAVEEILGGGPELVKDDGDVRKAAGELGGILSSSGPDTTQFEIEIRTADGEAVPCRDHMGYLPYEGEEFRGSVGILRDISDEQARRDELARDEHIIRAAGDPVYSLDADDRIEHVNDAFADLVGHDRERVLGSHLSSYLPDADYETYESLRASLGDGAETDRLTFETTLLAADGDGRDCVPMECHLALLHDDDFEVVGTTGILRDISERLAQEAELSLMRRAIDEASVGITITGPSEDDCPIVYANAAFEELTGYDADEVLGENHRVLRGPDTDEEDCERFREAIADEVPCSIELLNYRRDGTPFWNQCEITPVRDDDGSVTNYIGFQREVTERNARQRLLERQNERLSEFTRVVSHDLRTPLTTARGYFDIVAESPDDADPEDLRKLGQSLDRVEELLSDLTMLATQGETVVETEPLDFWHAAERAWETVPTADAELRFDRTDGGASPTVAADESRLRQLLENLFENAVDHGGSEVTVTVGRTHDGFYVEDDGDGFPDDRSPAECFETGVSERRGGGLGLAIVKRIAAAHDWTPTAERGSTGGARFVFTESATAARPSVQRQRSDD
ncbi:hybrid sensor histidine kinase/response regulator [Haloferax sp. Atlit-12N]|uniref:PAS domain S-box protein n=1 Tax=Haloferax sp. Atlit-12N TaxID=2077203 RepID=UPI000E240FF2|nr:PAS domain S-box protein [Haloferax sp. Atlit-12N]RDZ62009.1 hybrid sensor histidine kinase/response regulator [Haloferax sp. Atlit-12N]